VIERCFTRRNVVPSLGHGKPEVTMRGKRGTFSGRLGLVGMAALVVLTACNGQGGDGGETAEVAASKLTAPLAGAYKVKPNGVRVPPKQNELPVPLGSVEAHWYRAGGVYIIAFRGLDLEETGPLCPGSSAQTDQGFEHVTNAPTEKDACEGAQNLAGADAGVRICGPLVLYTTEIPEGTQGDLFASIEQYNANGTILGVTGVIDADRSAAPEIDPEADTYSLPPGLVKGESQITC
jgi:hypothetical protein